ncbi:protein ANTAGONIST OF LIKE HETEROCHROMATIN PROTEIN 1-like [Copidosoma floridanum]|uniref:protein ANTAGONIST OF LIKE HETEROCHROMATIN PROTEIN 1-like n=1 Tax=Copidosoma floridanum TaxID=29053 RepID=UPI000C6F97B8|nr:protein ANTAGONIST OF LIKE HETEROCHROMATIN PROTEIN 1-like [Copidosoma floridanum]
MDEELCIMIHDSHVAHFDKNTNGHVKSTERRAEKLRRVTFDYLLFLTRDQLEAAVGGFGNVPISAEKQLLIALWILGTPDSYRSVTSKFGVAKSTAWKSTFRVVKVLCNYRNYFIRWPSHEEAQETAVRIQEAHGFPGVIGALDGTHINISAPKNDPNAYINRKGKHSIQLQVICNDKLEFMHCYVGMPGSVHDMRVFKYSGVQDKCTDEYFPNDCHILADAAYTIQKCIMVPFKDNGHLSREETLFNTNLSRIRTMVERCIGLLKMRWRILLDKVPMRRTDLLPFYILATCVLHNICLKREDTFEYPIVIPDTENEYPEPLAVNADQKRLGEAKRRELVLTLQRNRDI